MQRITIKLDHFSVLFEQAEWILGKEYSWIHDGWRHLRIMKPFFASYHQMNLNQSHVIVLLSFSLIFYLSFPSWILLFAQECHHAFWIYMFYQKCWGLFRNVPMAIIWDNSTMLVIERILSFLLFRILWPKPFMKLGSRAKVVYTHFLNFGLIW